MLFNSLQFLVFFPTVTLLYFTVPQQFRWAVLLTASCIFYMAFVPAYLLILFLTIVIDYFAGIAIENARGQRRKAWLVLSIAANVSVLAVFKYVNFINANLADLARWLDWNYPVEALNIILPIGLSFHTFQAMSYTIEVYNGGQRAERHFGIYALYVMFFPQLVAGPIERPQNLLHQFYETHKFEYERVRRGLRLMLWGFFKKIVIADNCAVIVSAVFNEPQSYGSSVLVLAAVLFAYQIYCDFSGYSDIARGSARVLGFELMLNFNRPYAAKSIAEFWRRWHISLSTWFRDYVFIPLGGNRVSSARVAANLMIVFLISGLWHGANWTFIAWGGLHGLYIVSAKLTAPLRRPVHALFDRVHLGWLRRAAAVLLTFALVSVAWILFRANSMDDAVYIFRQLLWGQPAAVVGVTDALAGVGLSRRHLVVLFSAIALMEAAQFIAARRPSIGTLAGVRRPARWAVYYALIAWIVFFGQFGAREFIYFQF
jgi:alginate O-acetyltransferase complex protein AlgI